MKAYYLKPSNEEFEDSYAQAGLQPSTGTRGVIKHARVEYTKAAAATSMRAGGAGMQKGGKAMSAAGKGMTKAGMAMSRTGLGAVVGVPLMAVGGTARAAGAATSVAGKVAGQTGRTIRNNQRGVPKLSIKNAPGLVKDLKDTVKVTRTSIMILSWATTLWFTIQLPLALLTVVTFGATEAAASILPDWIVEWTAGNLLILMQLAVFFIGVGTLIAIGVIYSISGIHSFLGKGAHIKGPVFCLAVVGYLLPLVNVFPWFILWVLAVWRYPK